ncbi:MAG: hypothetical protein L0H10_25865, partial [Comamonas sp.]|nr:hypothetical protein [Comamonas sp.]
GHALRLLSAGRTPALEAAGAVGLSAAALQAGDLCCRCHGSAKALCWPGGGKPEPLQALPLKPACAVARGG